MSSYYNENSKKKFDINDFGLPPFATRYLGYLSIEKNSAPRSVYNYALSVRTFLRWVRAIQIGTSALDDVDNISIKNMAVDEIAALEPPDIFAFLAYCANTRQNNAKSRAAKLAAVRSLYEYLRTRDEPRVIKLNPAIDIATPKKEQSLPIYMTVSESRRLLDAVSGPFASRDYCMLLWFLSCGMRLSELVAINLNDIKDSSLLLHGKGRKERVVHLNSSCLAAFQTYLVDRKAYLDHGNDIEDENALFISMYSHKARRLSGRRVEQIVDHYIAAAGLQGNGYTAHKLRHTAATIMYQNTDAGLLEIQGILGHENVQTTTIYTHTSAEKLNETIDTVGNVLTGDGKPKRAQSKESKQGA